MDKFSRTTNRCERIVYPNSIPETTRPVMVYNTSCEGEPVGYDNSTENRWWIVLN